MLRLKELRKKKGLTLKEASKFFFVSDATLSRIENGIIEPSRTHLEAFAKFYKVSVDYILGLDEKEDRDTPFGLKESVINEMLKDDPNLLKTFQKLMEREDTALLFSKVKDLDAKTIKKVLKIIETITEEEEKEINGQ